MTLTLSPEIEKALMEAAAKSGKTPDELAEETLRNQYLSSSNVDDEEASDLRAKVKAARGSMAHLGPSHILEDRAADRILEERHWPNDELIQQHHLPTQIFPNNSLGK